MWRNRNVNSGDREEEIGTQMGAKWNGYTSHEPRNANVHVAFGFCSQYIWAAITGTVEWRMLKSQDLYSPILYVDLVVVVLLWGSVHNQRIGRM